jgi:hypothetical protein
MNLRLTNPYPRQWIARDLDTGLFGLGNTDVQAVEDLFDQLHEAARQPFERNDDSSDLLLLLVGSVKAARDLLAADKAPVAEAFLGRAVQLMEMGLAA